MAIADFVHLKVRSAYSLTEGANKVDKIVSLAKENAMPAVGVTDRNNLFGALEFALYAAGGGIQTGDVILSVGGKAVSSAADLREALTDAKSDGRHNVLMRVKTAEATRFIAVPIG